MHVGCISRWRQCGFALATWPRIRRRPSSCWTKTGRCVAKGPGMYTFFSSSAPSGLVQTLAPLPHGLRPFGSLRASCGLHSFAASRLGRLQLAWHSVFLSYVDQLLYGRYDFARFIFYFYLKRRLVLRQRL